MVEKKENQRETEKRKIPLKLIKSTSGGKNAKVKPINALEPSMVNEKKKAETRSKPRKATSRALKPKEAAGRKTIKSSVSEDNVDKDDALQSTTKLVVIDEDSVDDENVKKKFKKVEGKNHNKNSSGGGDGDMDDALQPIPKPVDVAKDSADVENVKMKLIKVAKDEKKKSGKGEGKATVKTTYEKQNESSSGDDDVNADEYSADVVNSSDVKPETVVGIIETKGTAGKTELEATDGEDEISSCGNDESSGENSFNDVNSRDAEPKRAAGKIKKKETQIAEEDKSSSSGDDVSTDNDWSEDVKTKKTAGNINLKETAGKDEVKSTDVKEDERSKDEDNMDMDTNDGRILKTLSRIENKLDDLVCERVNEKRMFAIMLHMPFDLVNDIIQYNLDISEFDLFLKFVRPQTY